MLTHIIPSSKRSEALGKYLLALSNSFTTTPKDKEVMGGNGGGTKEISVKRKRLHILYLLNDLIYHTKIRILDPSVASALEPSLEGLFKSAANFSAAPKHLAKLNRLLGIWEKRAYYTQATIDKLRKVGEEASQSDGAVGQNAVKSGADSSDAVTKTKDAPYTMPSTHGDPNTPWFDLPAGNLMQHIIPNNTKPIPSSLVAPLQLQPGPASRDLEDAVRKLLGEAKRVYGEEANDTTESSTWDVDELGQHVLRGNKTGLGRVEDTYYGWSEEFCLNVKRKLKGGQPGRGRDSRERSYEGSRSRSHSRNRTRSTTRSWSQGHARRTESLEMDDGMGGMPRGLGY